MLSMYSKVAARANIPDLELQEGQLGEVVGCVGQQVVIRFEGRRTTMTLDQEAAARLLDHR